MSKAHAFLSASAAHRWIACPPSAKLQEKYEDKGSEYAAQGTDAHTLAEWKALKLIGVDQPDPRENLTWYDQEMEEATDAYAQYMQSFCSEFGLTPATRSRIIANSGGSDDEADPMESLLKGGW